jgi:hypothetical protein
MESKGKATPPAKPDKTNHHTMSGDQVADLVEQSEQATAKAITTSAGDVWQEFLKYCEVCKGETPPRVPTHTGFSHALGFASERGYMYLSEKGGGYPATLKRIDAAIVEGVAQRMMNGKANQVGCIFWLKNKGGFRDRQPDEVALDNEDWLSKVSAFSAATTLLNARSDAPAQVATGEQAAAAELLLFESTDEPQDAAAGG